MHDTLRALLTQTIQQANPAGQDAYGKPLYSPPVPRPGRTEEAMLTVQMPAGLQVVTQTHLYLDGRDGPVPIGAQLTLPDGSTPPIQGRETVLYEYGQVDHYRLLF